MRVSAGQPARACLLYGHTVYCGVPRPFIELAIKSPVSTTQTGNCEDGRGLWESGSRAHARWRCEKDIFHDASKGDVRTVSVFKLEGTLMDSTRGCASSASIRPILRWLAQFAGFDRRKQTTHGESFEHWYPWNLVDIACFDGTPCRSSSVFR